MKLHFEPNLDYQLQAIEAVCDLFRSQEACRTDFTVTMKLSASQGTLGIADSDLAQNPARCVAARTLNDVLGVVA